MGKTPLTSATAAVTWQRNPRTFVLALATGALASWGCASSETVVAPKPGKGKPGISIVTRPAGGDTIDARLPTPLIVELRGPDSLLMRGARVKVSSILKYGHPACPLAFYTCIAYAVLFRQTDSPSWLDYTQGITVNADPRGRLSLDLKNGLGSGAGGVILEVSDSLKPGTVLYRDTLPFTVRSGQPFLTRLAPRDTVLSLGRRMSVAAVVLDRGGALLDVKPPLQTDAGVTVTGLTLEASSLRDGLLVARYPGTIPDTGRIRVVPTGVVAGLACWRCSQLVVTDLDGVNRRTIELGAEFTGVDWSSDGTRLFVSLAGPSRALATTGRLVTINTSGSALAIVADSVVPFIVAPYVRTLPDAEWIYFAGGQSLSALFLYRVQANGTGLESLNRYVGPYENGVLGVSPDGRYVAYGLEGPNRVAIVEVATGNTTRIPVTTGDVKSVRWNPLGTHIAYAGNLGVGIMRPDGSDQRFVVTRHAIVSSSLDWSPDGQWIITEFDYTSKVIEVSTMRSFTPPVNVGRAAWRP